MRFILSLFLVCFVLNAQNVERDIKKSKEKIQKTIQEQDKISKKLKALGDEIQSQSDSLGPLVEEIQILEKELEDNRGRYARQENDLKAFLEKEENLVERDEGIQHQITQLIARDLAFRIIANRKQITSEEGMVFEEFFNTMSKEIKNRIEFLTEEKKKLADEIGKISQEILQLQEIIGQQNQKRELLAQNIQRRNQIINNLKEDVRAYNQRLSEITKERENLDEILEKLNIKKRDLDRQAKNARLKQEHSNALAKKKREKNNDLIAPIDVKRMASSFRQISTVKYDGKKTIAPLESYNIDQKFGAYFDPVYKIKVFNESVILASKKNNANVRSVLDGKVVFAKETPVLKKVVIVEHPNQIHTIYAYLDKIAPTIRPGLKIKKGYVIGKVDDKLGFEVTKKDKHIDPLELIGK